MDFSVYNVFAGERHGRCASAPPYSPNLRWIAARKCKDAMAYVPVANTAEAQLIYTQDSQRIENTLYFQLPTTPTAADLLSLGGDLISWWSTNIAPLVTDDLELVQIECTDLTTATGPSVTSIPPTVVSGGVTENALPNNVSLAISFRTAQRGRSFRGRNYAVGLCENQVVQNTVNIGIVTAYQDAYNLLGPGSTVFSDDWAWVVVSRFHGKGVDGKPLPRAAGLHTGVTNAIIVDRTIDSQRRRLPGRGR